MTEEGDPVRDSNKLDHKNEYGGDERKVDKAM